MSTPERPDPAAGTPLRCVRDGVACLVRFERYQDNGRVAILLVEEATGAPYATATVNVGWATLADDEVVVEDYSEGEGNLAALEAAGVLADTGSRVDLGYVRAPIARLLVRPESP